MPQKHIFFFDESRFGDHSKLGLAWFLKGSRTPISVKLGFNNFYLYSAVNPRTGIDFSLELPRVNTDCMNAFLEHFTAFLGDEQIILIMDGAAWHKSKSLKVPKNIEILILPPYCPELNPVERLWLYIKQNTIKNKVFSTLQELKEVIYEFMNNLSVEVVKSVCGYNTIF
jgi:transposase